MTAGNNWVFTRRHFECVEKSALAWNSGLDVISIIYISIPKLEMLFDCHIPEKTTTFC